MRYLTLTLFSLLVAGCANWGYNPSYYYNEVLAVNLSGGTISQVSVDVLGVEKPFECESVNKSAMCRDYFGRRRYPAAGIVLTWTHPDGERKSAVVNPHIQAYFVVSLPLRIVMEINPDGSVKSYYEQEEPGDGPYLS